MTDTVNPPEAFERLNFSPILSAALRELQDNGYHGTTVRKIVNRAGLTMPALYYHYGNKEGVLVALLNIAMDDLIADLESMVDDPAQADPPTRLRQIVRATITHVTTRQALASLHREYRFLGEEAQERYVKRRRHVDGILTEVLRDGIESGDFHIDDIDYCKLAVLGMVQGVADWYRADGPGTPDEISEQYEALTLKLVGA